MHKCGRCCCGWPGKCRVACILWHCFWEACCNVRCSCLGTCRSCVNTFAFAILLIRFCNPAWVSGASAWVSHAHVSPDQDSRVFTPACMPVSSAQQPKLTGALTPAAATLLVTEVPAHTPSCCAQEVAVLRRAGPAHAHTTKPSELTLASATTSLAQPASMLFLPERHTACLASWPVWLCRHPSSTHGT